MHEDTIIVLQRDRSRLRIRSTEFDPAKHRMPPDGKPKTEPKPRRVNRRKTKGVA